MTTLVCNIENNSKALQDDTDSAIENILNCLSFCRRFTAFTTFTILRLWCKPEQEQNTDIVQGTTTVIQARMICRNC